MRQNKIALLFMVLTACACMGFSKPGFLDKRSAEEKRADIREMAAETLNDLYKANPEAKNIIENAAGYAVFGNFGMKIFVAGGGRGRGIVINQKTGQETFMKMVELQAGIGMGIKKFKLVWVFDFEQALEDFIHSGWEIGGQATAAAVISDKGVGYAGAMSMSKGVWLYQLTDDGLALELTAKGTKYYADKKLNTDTDETD